MTEPCAFCEIIKGQAAAEYVWQWGDAIAILPREDEHGRRGCTEGHILVIPTVHVRDFTEAPHLAALTAGRAAELAARLGGQWNEITSAGEYATQTVGHLHRHLVPRRAGDGLALPWTGAAKVADELDRLAEEITDDHEPGPYWVERTEDGALPAGLVRQVERIEARAAELRGGAR